MRAFAICCCAAVLMGCTKSENQRAAGTSATVSLADFAGTWRVRGFNEAGDSIVAYDLIATADPSAWTTMLPGRPPIPQRLVTVAGDSITTEAGPFESVLRPGVQVRTNAVIRLQGDKLVGTTIAHYTTTGPDSVLRIRMEGTRAP
ncbi:MAG: hypothetical protein ACREMR_00885 [Gemmatimonadales bacterium]